MLARLGQFTETRPGAAGGHSYLPDAAMTLIAQYQRNPLLAGAKPGPSGQDDSGDPTSASLTELPASYQPKPRRPTPRPRQPAGGGGGSGRTWPGSAGSRSAPPWSWAASSSARR